MLKNNNKKKRVAVDSHQSQLVDEETMYRVRHQRLLQEFLDLQQTFVSNKRKLQTANQKKEILLAEVSFLRRRYKYMMEMQSKNFSLKQNLISEKDSSAEELVSVKSSTMEDLVSRKCSTMQFQGEIVGEPLRAVEKKKPKIINGKSFGKKKISLRDHVEFECLNV